MELLMRTQESLNTAEHKLTRRRVLKAMGLLPLTALSSDTVGEYHKSMQIEPHVAIEKQEITKPMDLVRQGIWHMEGAGIDSSTMVLAPVDLQIRNKRQNGEYQPNPPVNLYGTRLHAEGQFALSATIQATPNAAVSLRLYTNPPLRFDDFRFLPSPELEYHLTAGQITINARQGDSPEPQPVLQADIPNSPQHNLQVLRTANGSLQFMINGTLIGHAPAQLLDGNDIWLGLHSDRESAKISSLTATPLGGDKLHHINTSNLQITQPTPNGLQTLVDPNKLLIGTGASLSHLLADERYAQLVLGSEFGIITPENGLKPQDAQPTEGIFTFAESDSLVDIALRHSLQVHGHALMFDKAMPTWMQDLPYRTKADKQRLRDVLWNHVHTVASHFKGRVSSWDVWNELVDGFNNQASLSKNPFTLGLGEQALDIAFFAARDADPNATLFINDYGLETNPKGRGRFMLDLLARAKNRGVPVDGLGIQGHVYEMPRDYIKPRVLKSLIKDASKIGLQVRVTELDVTHSYGSYVQARQYAKVAKVCLQEPNCTGYTVWGPTDAYGSTISEKNGQLTPGSALLYDTSFQSKPARTAIARELQAS